MSCLILQDMVTAEERVTKPVWDNPHLEAGRLAIIEWMGERWMLHPAHAVQHQPADSALARAMRRIRDKEWRPQE